MEKFFKLKGLSFQFRRFNQTSSSLTKSPLASALLFSPLSPKSTEITYPIFPDVPPPTPTDKSRGKTTSISSVDDTIHWFSSDEDNKEIESMISSSDNFDLSNDLGYINNPPDHISTRLRVSDVELGGKVNESVAVVKSSDDPHEDFKRSMMEMIMEKQLYDCKDLEQLLQCFLSLNSRYYHAVIVQAFSEIWELLFQ